MTDLDPQINEWLGSTLELRDERIFRHNGGTSHPDHWSNHVCPVILDGIIVDDGCQLRRSGPLGGGLRYEWSPAHQRSFEDLVAPRLDIARWDGLVDIMRSHWCNSAAPWGETNQPWLDLLAPGLHNDLHELGKTREFRMLRLLPLDDMRSGPAAHVNDPRAVRERPVVSRDRRFWMSMRGMAEWYSHRYEDIPWTAQICVICGQDFWPQALSELDLGRAGLPRYCSPCVTLMRWDVWALGYWTADQLKPMLVNIAERFYEMTGVFPHQNISSTPIGELPAAHRDMWARLLLIMPHPETVKRLFGTWREFLHAAGMLDQAPRKGWSGYVTIAADGHIALSIGERIICDWLNSHGINHEKEPKYPTHPLLNPEGKLRADWLIGDCWVEFAGRMDDTKYAANMARKQQLAKECGLRHLVLLPAEVQRLEGIATENWGYTSISLL
jgi:hypothetical protein